VITPVVVLAIHYSTLKIAAVMTRVLLDRKASSESVGVSAAISIVAL
jgi:hypothetical protein